MALGVPASILGLIVSGDCSGETIYTDRHGRKVHYPVAPPKEPPTDFQIAHRARFRAAQQQYMALSPADRQKWEQIALRANLCLTGQNLLIHVAMMNALGLLDTLIRQTGVSVDPPEIV